MKDETTGKLKEPYTQKEVDTLINNTRIEERYMANQLMGNLGIPAQSRLSPDGKRIYEEAANIVMGLLLKGSSGNQQKKSESEDED